MKKIFIIILIILQYGCWRLPSNHNLGKNYYYSMNHYTDRTIIKMRDKGEAYDVIIPTVIVNYVFDSSYVLIDQKPIDQICICNDSCRKKNINDWEKKFYKQCTDEFEKSNFHQYWIINKINDSVLGPFSKETFIRKRKEIGIPEKLVFGEPIKIISL
ncbi:MAG: hypothetical protein Q8880_02860 [Bacteroidota bacterium]|nr:hypothetical protein [Bacteroidota bacterium]